MVNFTDQSENTTEGHLCFFYESKKERLYILAKYFKKGLRKNELCVFVTADKPAEVIRNFKSLGCDISDAVGKGAFRIFGMSETYLPDGRFAADYMLQNVQSFIEDAKNLGYSGLRTAGEMAWLFDHDEYIPDAINYENKVNDLTRPGSHFTGLCLYPLENSFMKVMAGAMQTHPSFIYNGGARPNPYYKAI